MKKSYLLLIVTVVVLSMSVVFAAPVPTPGGNVDGRISGIAETILGIIQFMAFAVAVGMILVIGIKYMMSGASGVAKAKDTLVPYIIGAILVGGATTIASWALDLWGS